MYRAIFQAFAKWIVLTGCAALLSLGCDEPQMPPKGDREPAPTPPRIVSLDPELSRLLVALDLERALVGLDRASFRQLGLANPADVGDARRPDLEAVAALRPDFVFMLDAPTRERVALELAKRGAEVPRFDPKSANEIIQVIHEIGIATGRRAASRAVVRQLTDEISRIATARDGSFRRRVIWVLAWDPPVIVGDRGLLHEMLELAGGEMALHRLQGDRVETTLAEIAASDPDLILISAPRRAPQPIELDAPLAVLPDGIDRLPTLALLERIRILHAAIYPDEPIAPRPSTNTEE